MADNKTKQPPVKKLPPISLHRSDGFNSLMGIPPNERDPKYRQRRDSFYDGMGLLADEAMKEQSIAKSTAKSIENGNGNMPLCRQLADAKQAFYEARQNLDKYKDLGAKEGFGYVVNPNDPVKQKNLLGFEEEISKAQKKCEGALDL